MRGVVFGVVLVSLGLIGCDLEVLQPKDEYVAVIGQSEVSVSPDVANFTIDLRVLKETSEEAVEEVRRQSTEIIAALLENGIGEKNVSTEYFAVSPAYEEVTENGRAFERQYGYISRYSLKVHVLDLEKLSELVYLVGQFEVELSDLEYSVASPSELIAQARESAVKDAQNKASQFADSNGRGLGKVLVLEESGVNRYRLTHNLQQNSRQRSWALDEITVSASMVTDSKRVLIVPPDVTVDIKIFAKFELE